MRGLGVLGLLVSSVWAFWACSGSSSDGSPGYTPNPVLCQSFCDAGAKAGCPTGTPEQCQADCEQTRQQYSVCLMETDALLSCATQKGILCVPGGTLVNGCDAEKDALSLCGACVPTGSDDPCEICSKPACCAEYKAFGTAPDLKSYMNCVPECSDLACLESCDKQFPTAAQAFHAVDECRNNQCPSACAGLPSEADAVGRYCAAIAKAGCPMTSCESSFGDMPVFGCGLEFYESLDCVASKPITCTDGYASTDPACTQAFMECMNPGDGGVIVGGGAGGTDTGGTGGGVVIGGAGGTGGSFDGG